MDSLLLREAQLHGLKRLEDRKYRWHWFLALLLLLWAAISIMLSTIYRFQSNPTHVERLERFMQGKMLFPTVLIFPEVDYPDYKVEAFLDQFDDRAYPTGLNRTYLKDVIRQLAAFYSPDAVYNLSDLKNIERFIEHNNLNLEKVTQNLTTSCEESLLRELESGVLSVPISRNGEFATYEIGYRSGLMFVVNQSVFDLYDMDLDYKWFAMTTPQRFVDVGFNGTPISPGKEVWFGYQEEGFFIADDTKFLSASQRHCTLSHERLKYFPTYHKSYCVVECGMQEMLTRCHCIMHNQPAPPSVPRCRADQLMCAKFISASVNANKCGCLSTCDYIENIIHTSEYFLNPKRTPVDTFYKGINYSQTTIIRVFLSDRTSYIKLRKPIFEQIEFYAQMGGVFNVTFGCSLLSLLELIQLAWYKFRKMQLNAKLIKTEEISRITSTRMLKNKRRTKNK